MTTEIPKDPVTTDTMTMTPITMERAKTKNRQLMHTKRTITSSTVLANITWANGPSNSEMKMQASRMSRFKLERYWLTLLVPAFQLTNGKTIRKCIWLPGAMNVFVLDLVCVLNPHLRPQKCGFFRLTNARKSALAAVRTCLLFQHSQPYFVHNVMGIYVIIVPQIITLICPSISFTMFTETQLCFVKFTRLMTWAKVLSFRNDTVKNVTLYFINVGCSYSAIETRFLGFKDLGDICPKGGSATIIVRSVANRILEWKPVHVISSVRVKQEWTRLSCAKCMELCPSTQVSQACSS